MQRRDAQHVPEKNARSPEPSAKPRSLDEEALHNDFAEPGLSVGPEDLGEHFMVEAMEQGNLTIRQLEEADDRSIVEAAPSDAPLTGDNFDASRDVWESTVALATEQENLDGAVALRGADELEEEERAVRRRQSRDSVPPVVLTENVVREASLFDQVGVDTETDARAPRIDTDDVGRHARAARPKGVMRSVSRGTRR